MLELLPEEEDLVFVLLPEELLLLFPPKISRRIQASVSARSDLNAARELFRQASQKFAIALQLDPQSANAANDWGVALGEEAIAISAAAPGNLADARILWDQARQKYALGLQIDPTNGRIARNWASELSIEASSLAPSNLPAARELWKQAYERLANVIGTDPDDALAFVNLTSAMLQERAALLKASSQTLSLANTETVDLLQKAKQMLLALQGNAAGSGAYNLACVYALEGQTANAMQWLERSSAAGRLPKKSHLLKDSDLENLRNTPAFIAWFAKLP